MKIECQINKGLYKIIEMQFCKIYAYFIQQLFFFSFFWTNNH